MKNLFHTRGHVMVLPRHKGLKTSQQKSVISNIFLQHTSAEPHTHTHISFSVCIHIFLWSTHPLPLPIAWHYTRGFPQHHQVQLDIMDIYIMKKACAALQWTGPCARGANAGGKNSHGVELFPEGIGFRNSVLLTTQIVLQYYRWSQVTNIKHN